MSVTHRTGRWTNKHKWKVHLKQLSPHLEIYPPLSILKCDLISPIYPHVFMQGAFSTAACSVQESVTNIWPTYSMQISHVPTRPDTTRRKTV